MRFDSSIIKDILLDLPGVSNVTIRSDFNYNHITYACCVNCDLLITGKPIAVVVCVPSNWQRALFHVYIKDSEKLPFMPHIEESGKICLFDLEGVIIDVDFEGLLTQSINKAIEILSDGISGKNHHDFVREFTSYWSRLPKCQKMKCVIPDNPRTQVIKIYEEQDKKRKNETYSDYINRHRNRKLFAAPNGESFSFYGVTGQQQNGLFCYIKADDFIFPPDYRYELTTDYINSLLLKVQRYDLESICKKQNQFPLIVFGIEEPDDTMICIAVHLSKATLFRTPDEALQLQSGENSDIYPVQVVRVDKKHLMQRIIENNYSKEKNCLIIGAGSIGSHVCNELVKTGWERITIVDPDYLKEENIFRHLLGIEYIDSYKVNSLDRYFKKNIPQTEIKPLSECIQDLVEEGSVDLSDYDVIISTTGDHNVNRWLNKYVHEASIDSPIVYAWNEPLDIGCHVAVIQANLPGCYECLFCRDSEDFELYDATAFCERKQAITRNYGGCAGSFIPYGPSISLKSAVLCVEWIDRVLGGRCGKNYVISLKGEGYYFRKAGLVPSKVYDEQKTMQEIRECSSFSRQECVICG